MEFSLEELNMILISLRSKQTELYDMKRKLLETNKNFDLIKSVEEIESKYGILANKVCELRDELAKE